MVMNIYLRSIFIDVWWWCVCVCVCLCVCVSNPVPKGMFIQVVMHAELKNRGQQGVHSSAANEDSCEYSVKQIETSICVPVSLISLHRSSKRLSSEPQKDQVCSEFFFSESFSIVLLEQYFYEKKEIHEDWGTKYEVLKYAFLISRTV